MNLPSENPLDSRTSQETLRVYTVLWIALTSSYLLLLFVSWFRSAEKSLRLDQLLPDYSNPMFLVLSIMGGIMILVAELLPTIIGKSAGKGLGATPSERDLLRVAIQPFILGCALRESVALFGFIISFLGNNFNFMLPFVFVATTLALRNFPNMDKIKALVGIPADR